MLCLLLTVGCDRPSSPSESAPDVESSSVESSNAESSNAESSNAESSNAESSITASSSAASSTDATSSDELSASAADGATAGRPVSEIGRRNALVDEAALERWPDARVAQAGYIPAYAQRDGDPERGRRALLEEAYVACGLPERVARLLLEEAPSILPIEGRHARADGLPYFNNVFTDASGQSVVGNNCLTCHGVDLFGELVVGLGNEFLDFTDDAAVAVERAGALVRGDAETRVWERYADRLADIAPSIRMQTIGTNPANSLTFALIAHRDAETNAWLDKAALPLPSAPPTPVSVPPWWRMNKKHALFNTGEGRADHARFMMAATMLCGDDIESLEVVDRYAPDIRSYIASLEPPAWPFAIDRSLAGRGKSVFERTCSECHGRYGDDAQYPNRLVALETIGTDRRLAELNSVDGLPWIDWFNRSWYGEASRAAPGSGYVAPPLDGIWATGPFLHNGSVPTIRQVLHSPSRPVVWQHRASDASDPALYDRDQLGWLHERIDPASVEIDGDPRHYDTRRSGHGHAGHYFGDGLDEEERRAVLEYLKTL